MEYLTLLQESCILQLIKLLSQPIEFIINNVMSAGNEKIPLIIEICFRASREISEIFHLCLVSRIVLVPFLCLQIFQKTI